MDPEITIFTPMDVFFWACVKDNVYVYPLPTTSEDPVTRITENYAETVTLLTNKTSNVSTKEKKAYQALEPHVK